MLESGSSGSVRGVPSNGHPYRDPPTILAVRRSCREGQLRVTMDGRLRRRFRSTSPTREPAVVRRMCAVSEPR